MDFSNVGKSFWNNNTSGLSCEMNVLKEIELSEFVGHDFETEEQVEKFIMDIFFDKSTMVKYKHSFLSDVWNEELGELEVHSKEVVK